MLLYLVSAWVAFAAFDAIHTIWMLEKHGIEIEMNGLIRKLCGWWGTTRGSLVGIFIPTCAIAGLCWMFHAEKILLVLVLARLGLFLLQLKYHIFNVKPSH